MDVSTMFKKEEGLDPTIEDYEIMMEEPDSFSDFLDINNISPSLLISSQISYSTELQIQEDDTVDIATVHLLEPIKAEYEPVAQRQPNTLNFTGNYNFNLEIDGNDTHANKYLYSAKLNRIYVGLKVNFLIRFKFDSENLQGPMYIRATTAFSDETESQKRVERCLQHALGDVNNMDTKIAYNVLHSASEFGTKGVYYCGDKSSPDKWYSLVVQMKTSGPHAFQFVCKNSCPGGINRRPIEIIFTLEDEQGKIHGRQSVGARVCSCPKRDIGRDETYETKPGGKRRISKNTTPAPKKKVRSETTQVNEPLTLPPIPVVNRKVMLAGLEMMLHMTEMVAEGETDQQVLEQYNNSINTLKDKINDLKTGNNV